MESELDKILRGLKAMYVDVSAISGEEEIYSFDQAKSALLNWRDRETKKAYERGKSHAYSTAKLDGIIDKLDSAIQAKKGADNDHQKI